MENKTKDIIIKKMALTKDTSEWYQLNMQLKSINKESQIIIKHNKFINL